ncbi:MAG TPA: lipopolysaccharide heptosyltransferase II [Gemmatimonadales bacterium]|nr:lipopolysaccharide heptosyltransferase II [Gemmatimonadales bacterium]
MSRPAPDAPRVLVVRFSSIGDVILVTPLLRALRARHPAAELAVLTKQRYVELLQDNPRVSRVLGLAADEPLPALAARLRAERYTHLLDLHGSLRSRALRLLVPGRWRGFRKHRLARSALIHAKRNLYPGLVPMAERYFRAARDLDVTPDGGPPELFLGRPAIERVAGWLARSGLGRDRPLLAVAPGAAHATKRWPEERWIALVRRLVHTGAEVAVVGGPEDRELCARVAAAGGARAASAAGEFGLQDTGALIRRAAALVSGDTGVMHLATAVGTPVVALFGPTVEAFGFFPYRARATVLERRLPCRPCSSQGGARCPLGHHRCLVDIAPEEVAVAVDALVS